MRWPLERGAKLLEGGTAPVSGLVLPTGKFFPDHFDGSVQAVGRLLSRVVKLAGLSDMTIEPRIVTEEAAGGSSCASGACGVGPSSAGAGAMRRTERHGDDWTVNLVAGEIGHPVGLTTALVRAVSHIFMSEADLYDRFDPREAEAATDLCGTFLGFGALLCNGAYIYKKG